MMWRCRNSAAANRRALHSDYTSATEKTPTPLNERCTQPQNPSCIAATRQHHCMRCTTDVPTSAHECAKFPQYQKPLWNRCFHACRVFNSDFARTMKIVLDIRNRHCKRRRCDGFTQVKNFFHRRTCGGVARRRFDQKRANRAPSDSRRGACALFETERSEVFWTAHENCSPRVQRVKAR